MGVCMKYLIKTVGLVACLITFSACEFGKTPDMSKYEEEEDEGQNTSLSFDGCDDACVEQFQNLLIQKYGTDWDKVCDQNCIETELDTYTKSLNSGTNDLVEASAQVSGADNPEVVSEQVSIFKFPENCDAGCQSEFMIYIVFNYGSSCDDACKKIEFDMFFEQYAPLGNAQGSETTGSEQAQPTEQTEQTGESTEVAGQTPESKQENTSPTTPQSPAPGAPTARVESPVPSPVVLPSTFQVDPNEINSFIAKLGFDPDTVVILTPRFALSTLDAIKANIKFTAEEGMLIDMLPTLMMKAKYLILAYQKNTSSLSFVVVSPDAVANRNIETTILRSGSYQVTASEKDILKLGSNIGFAKLSDAIMAGTPYSLVDSILKGTAPAVAPEGQSHAKCISILKDKTFAGFMSRIPQPNSLQQLFNLPGIELQGPDKAACWYKVR